MPTISKQSAKPSSKPAPSKNGSDSVWDAVQTVRMLLYGSSATGKTTFAASHPGRIKWLICSGGKKPGELRSIDTPENRKRIHPVVLNSSDDFRNEIAGLDDYDAVVLDHASGFADILLKEILGVDELPEQRGWGTASQQQYGQLSMQCKESFRALLNSPCDIIIVAQERVFGGTDDGVGSEIIKPTVGAALTPSVTGWLNPACDYVVQTFKRQKMKEVKSKIGDKVHTTYQPTTGVDYCLRTGPDGTYQTKFRMADWERVPDVIVNPTWKKFLDVIEGGK